jgi:hypothetical protein
MLRDDGVEQLDGNLRITLIVLDEEVDRSAGDSARGVDVLLDERECGGFVPSDESADTGQRRDDVDRVRIGGGDRAGAPYQREGEQQRANGKSFQSRLPSSANLRIASSVARTAPA